MKQKFLTFFLLFIILICFSISSFAITSQDFPIVVTYNDVTYEIPLPIMYNSYGSIYNSYDIDSHSSDIKNYAIFQGSPYLYVFLFFTDDIKVTFTDKYNNRSDNTIGQFLHLDGTPYTKEELSGNFIALYYYKSEGVYEYRGSNIPSDFFSSLSSPKRFFIYSTIDIYDYYNTEEIFFQGTPVQNNQGVVILETAEQIPQVMIQVLHKIIPVGLVILSAILVISLIKSVICRMQ